MIAVNQFRLLLNLFLLYFLTWSSSVIAQQNYSGNSVLDCNSNDEKGPSTAFLYTCNGVNKSCLAFLIFKSQPSYNTVAKISNLTSSDPYEIARINNATMLTVFPTDKEVIVPVNCACATKSYYQAESKYMLRNYDTYFIIANNTYQGLSTCNSLMRENPYGELDLQKYLGRELRVPLRCACPTQHQAVNGTRYLLTYPVNWGDSVSNLAERFKVSPSILIDANGLSTQDPVLFPFTTLLIPLSSRPQSSWTIIHNHQAPILPSVPSTKMGKSKRKLYITVAIIGGFVLVLCVILSAMFLFRNRSAKLFKPDTKGKTKWASSADIREEIATIEHVSKLYSFQEIMEATENFSSKNRVEGSVYRGVFSKGIFTIKKMSTDASNQVNILKKINHFNLIKLQGYCINNGSFYLVFEYMENGSLREWLSKKRSIEHQSWAKRIQIALDIANGLQYLHNFTDPCYVHKDVNTSNILLNSRLRAKIANFSLAKETERDIISGTPTSHLVGTRGYMASEYLEVGMVTPSIDVYAFGVVLLELVTGKDPIIVQDGREVMLSAAIVSLMGKENAETNLSLFIDPSLTGNRGKTFALELAKLSLACLQQDPQRRPNMTEVVSSLLKMHANMHKTIPPTINESTPLER
ncbi:hypothetical protein L6164_015387 [Bauhinia variegata]|uniref:Uncharacterized protein n=1 Tax=Bauhinia variegata TaxID=167791 RepID=A0ACB9NKG9_BAUVA|nr:hypothetical protein L6164_015387 [Bauhinia variegata]